MILQSTCPVDLDPEASERFVGKPGLGQSVAKREIFYGATEAGFREPARRSPAAYPDAPTLTLPRFGGGGRNRWV